MRRILLACLLARGLAAGAAAAENPPFPEKPRIHARISWDAAEDVEGVPVCALYGRDVAYTRVTVHHTDLPVPDAERRLAREWLGLSPDARALSLKASRKAAAEHMRAVQRLHFEKGWSDIGYHFVIDWMGRIHEGRPLGALGAHTDEENRGNIGVALMGDFDRERPTPVQEAALERLVAWLAREYRIAPSAIKGHREYSNTACPGRYLAASLREIRLRLSTGRLSAPEPVDVVREFLKPWVPGRPVLADSRLAQRLFDGLLSR